jgi:hypothetical protein
MPPMCSDCRWVIASRNVRVPARRQRLNGAQVEDIWESQFVYATQYRLGTSPSTLEDHRRQIAGSSTAARH